jgi:hypothetical protein
MTEPTNQTNDPFPCFKELSPATQRFILRWCALPWTVHELLEDEPERALILQEIKAYDLLLCD